MRQNPSTHAAQSWTNLYLPFCHTKCSGHVHLVSVAFASSPSSSVTTSIFPCNMYLSTSANTAFFLSGSLSRLFLRLSNLLAPIPLELWELIFFTASSLPPLKGRAQPYIPFSMLKKTESFNCFWASACSLEIAVSPTMKSLCISSSN